jgi:hypothetical protein
MRASLGKPDSRLAQKSASLRPMPPLIEKAERARQFARAIASDLAMYNEAKLTQGIQEDTLFDVMKDEIEEGRSHFRSRVTPEIATTNLFERALVDILVKQRGQHIKSKIW